MDAHDALAQAQALYDEMLEIDPREPDIWHLLGTIFFNHHHFERAIELMDKTLHLNPHHPNAHYIKANALNELRCFEAALEHYTCAIQMNPAFSEAYFNKALVLKQLERYEEAVETYTQAIACDEHFALAYSNRGNVYKALNAYENALENYEKAIELDPEFGDAYANRAIILFELRHYTKALESCNKAIALAPNSPHAYCTKADTLKILNHHEEALELYNKALELSPLFVEAHCNKGNALKALRRYDEALESYTKALEINPNYPNAYRNVSLLFLVMGRLKEGFELYEWRWQKDDFTSFQETFSQPLWLGKESIANKTILIHAEQGLGDVLHFCRYLALLKQKGATVIFTLDASLYPLLKGLDGVDVCLIKGSQLPSFDYHSPLLSLPLACGTTLETIPHATPYIKADPTKVAAWEKRLSAFKCPKVGLAWSGNPLHNNDHNRSLPLEQLVPHLPEGYTYISLQQEVRESDKPFLNHHPHIHFFGESLHDFSDTAALCECMDILISVDTSVAHLAGAMNKKTLILLPYAPEWRWMDEREDSPWYPSVRLLRQKEVGEWESILSTLPHVLASLKA